MLIQTARGRFIGGGAILLFLLTGSGWMYLSRSPSAVQSALPEASVPTTPPVATVPLAPPPPPESVQTAVPESADEPEPPIAPATTPALSPAEEKARATVEGYPAERERILAELEAQSLEETIGQALHVWPSDAFTAGYSRGFFMEDRQKYLLQDPRLARLLHAAVNGTEEERAAIQAQVMQIIEDMLAERQKRDEGLDYDEGLLNTGPGSEIYPLVLAEVDRTGESLPLLLAWYDAEQGPDRSEEEMEALYEKMGVAMPPPGTILLPPSSSSMNMIAVAARRIAARTDFAWVETTPESPEGFTSHQFSTRGLGGTAVEELSGYKLLESLSGTEIYDFMNHLHDLMNP